MSERLIPPGYGQPNFKKPLSQRLRKDKPAAEKRPGMSAKHCDLIRAMPCAITLKMPCGEIHHLQNGTVERGAGLRSTDRWGIPLTHALHMELHKLGSRREPEWFAKHGIDDPLGLASALWHSTGDLPKMIRILMSHRRA